MCKKVLWLLKNLNIKLSHDPEISLLGMFPKGLKTQTNTCTYMFTAALFTRAKMWKVAQRAISGSRHTQMVVSIYDGVLLNHLNHTHKQE